MHIVYRLLSIVALLSLGVASVHRVRWARVSRTDIGLSNVAFGSAEEQVELVVRDKAPCTLFIHFVCYLFIFK